MKTQNKLNAIFIVIIAVALGLACGGSGGSQQTEANKFVDQTNAKLEEAKVLMAKTEARNTALFSANIQTEQQLQILQNANGRRSQSDCRRLRTSFRTDFEGFLYGKDAIAFAEKWLVEHRAK